MAINGRETALYVVPPDHDSGDPAAWQQIGLTHPDSLILSRTSSTQIETIDKIPSSFPEAPATLRYYTERFEGSITHLNVRNARQWEGGSEATNATVVLADEMPLDLEDPEIRQEAVRSCAVNLAKDATRCSWWCGINDDLKFLKGEEPTTDEAAIFAKHSFIPAVDGVRMKDGYDVYEMGAPSNEADIETVANAMNIIDQYSGGALVRSRVVLVSGMSNKGECLGANTKDATYLNMRDIHELADSTGVNPSDILATALVHEVLGHGLERWRFGDVDMLFPEHFEYSEDFTPGDIFSVIHTAIRAKDEAHSHSQPMREYGAVAPSEDLATSVDATVSKAEGWDTTPIPRFVSTIDEYRRDIVMQLMVEAAEMVGSTSGNPGFVGSEIRYIKDGEGHVIGSGPARTIEHIVINAQTAIEQEAEEITTRLMPHEVIVARAARRRKFLV